MEVTKGKPLKKQKFFILLSYHFKLADTTEEIKFLLLWAAEIKYLPIQWFYSRSDLDKKKCIFRFWTTFWMKLLFMLSKDLKLGESSNLLNC